MSSRCWTARAWKRTALTVRSPCRISLGSVPAPTRHGCKAAPGGRGMTQQETDASVAARWGAPAMRRMSSLLAHLLGAAGLAAGVADTLAKRHKNAKQEPGPDREARREERRDARRSERDDDDRDAKREARLERQEGRQQEDDERGRHARNGSTDHEQKANGKKDDEPNNNDNSDDNNDDGGNDRGNAGSGFFDSPLARKTRRRANDFDDNRDRDDGADDDRLTGNVDDDGHHFETNSISFTNGPDGLEVVTGNIEYSAPPTPTPTPFPTLTLPERDRLDVFGDRVTAAPTSVPSGSGPSNGSAAPPSSNAGTSVSTGSRPSPVTPDTNPDGGDNSSDFLS